MAQPNFTIRLIHLEERELMITISIGSLNVVINEKKLLSDTLPARWVDEGMDKIIFTALYRKHAQKWNERRMAEEWCTDTSDIPKLEIYLKDRISVGEKIVRDSGLSEDQLIRMPQILVRNMKAAGVI